MEILGLDAIQRLLVLIEFQMLVWEDGCPKWTMGAFTPGSVSSTTMSDCKNAQIMPSTSG